VSKSYNMEVIINGVSVKPDDGEINAVVTGGFLYYKKVQLNIPVEDLAKVVRLELARKKLEEEAAI